MTIVDAGIKRKNVIDELITLNRFEEDVEGRTPDSNKQSFTSKR